MGLVMSHTYNLGHAYMSHTPHCKAPYISGLIEGDRVAIDIETDSRQDAMVENQPVAAISLFCHMQSNIVSQAIGQVAEQ